MIQQIQKEHGSRGGSAPRLKPWRPLKPGEKLVQVRLCPRCLGRHSLIIKPLNNAPHKVTHFSICRKTDQPIIFNGEHYV